MNIVKIAVDTGIMTQNGDKKSRLIELDKYISGVKAVPTAVLGPRHPPWTELSPSQHLQTRRIRRRGKPFSALNDMDYIWDYICIIH